MEIYIARHAQSEGNKTQSYLPDSGLSYEGIKQADLLGEHLSELQIDLIYSSDATRAKETASIVAAKIRVNIELLHDLREYDRPTELLNKTVKSVESEQFESQRIQNFQNPDWKFSDDENFNELKDRASKVLHHLTSEHSSQKILLISHGTFTKMMLALMIFGNNLNVQTFWDFRHHTSLKNSSISTCSFSENNGWVVTSWGNTNHLKNL